MSLVIHGLHLPKMLGGEEMHIDVRIFSGGDVIMATSNPPYYKKFQAEQIQEGQEEPPTPQKEPLCKAYVFGDGPEVNYEEGLIAAYRKVVGNG